MTIGSTLARLFADPWDNPRPQRREPSLTTTLPAPQGGRDVVTAAPIETTAVPALPPPDPAPRLDLRSISPRAFAEATHELYLDGTLTWDEYRTVGFPSELDPRFDETIGALTGEKARPDHPRDMLAQWEQRVDFERRMNPGSEQLRITETVLDKLTALTLPPLRLSA